MIDKFVDYYHFLSNFYMRPFVFDGIEYKSVEHAYQSFKSNNDDEREYIRNLSTASETKKAGRLVNMREDWEDIKYNLMLDLVRAKFQDVYLCKLLMETLNNTLIEGNTWHDNVWGDCKCESCSKVEGKNWLGEILMIVREESKINF